MNLTPEMRRAVNAQETKEVFLTLLTLTHPDWIEPIRLVNNSSDIISRANVYRAFPFTFVLPQDDGEKVRDITISFDNTTLDLITLLRSVTTEISVLIEHVLASLPNEVQSDAHGLVIRNITYNASTVVATLSMDNFLNIEVPSERYTPATFRGLF